MRIFLKNSLNQKLEFLLISMLLFFSSEAFSVIKITSVSYASGYDLTLTTPTIWGALSGPDCTGSTTCNSCDLLSAATDPSDTCAEVKVNPSGDLKICYSHGSGEAANYIITTTESTSSISNSDSSTEVASGSSGCVYIAWGDLCDELSDTANTECETKVNKSIYLVADKIASGTTNTRDTGEEVLQVNIRAHNVPIANNIITASDCSTSAKPCAYNLYLYPGDEKAIIDSSVPLSVSPGFPTSDDFLTIEKVRFSYAQVGSSDFVELYSSSYINKEVTSDGELTSTYLKGLENGVEYSFRVSVIDEAGNIFNTNFSGDTISESTVEPLEVYGVLEESKCFIASAAYGSVLSPHLNILREFRDKILLSSNLGTWFVNKYYKYSPKYATELVKHPRLRALVRIALFPSVALAYIALAKDFHLILAGIILSLALASTLIKIRRQRSSL